MDFVNEGWMDCSRNFPGEVGFEKVEQWGISTPV